MKVSLPTFEVKTHAVKVVLEPDLSAQTDLFHRPAARTVEVDLQRKGSSALARAVRKELLPDPEQRATVVLMLDDKLAFSEGEILDLVVRDVETEEILSPPGMKLTVARSL